MIKRINNKYVVVSESGKILSKPFATKEAAEQRLRQIEYYKRKEKK